MSSFHFHTSAIASGAACLLLANSLCAGSYAPAADVDGSTAIAKDDTAFVGWATSVVSYVPGTYVEDEWRDTSKVLGTPGNDVYDIASLGRAGTISLSFDEAFRNGHGWDFAVFENSFGDGFLELAYVEVSSDGTNFARFPSHSETASAVGPFATNMDATNIDGLAGKYRLGYGTPFDLSDLIGVSGVENVDLNNITQVRLVDIVGDGSALDSDGNIIYDPYPTSGSAGFDLDAIGVRYFASTATDGWTDTWYGNAYIFAEGEGWIYSTDNLAFQYISPLNETSAWFYDLQLGWIYSNSASYPYIYIDGLTQWAYFYYDATDADRWYCLWDESLSASLPSFPYATANELVGLGQ